VRHDSLYARHDSLYARRDSLYVRHDSLYARYYSLFYLESGKKNASRTGLMACRLSPTWHCNKDCQPFSKGDYLHHTHTNTHRNRHKRTYTHTHLSPTWHCNKATATKTTWHCNKDGQTFSKCEYLHHTHTHTHTKTHKLEPHLALQQRCCNKGVATKTT